MRDVSATNRVGRLRRRALVRLAVGPSGFAGRWVAVVRTRQSELARLGGLVDEFVQGIARDAPVARGDERTTPVVVGGLVPILADVLLQDSHPFRADVHPAFTLLAVLQRRIGLRTVGHFDSVLVCVEIADIQRADGAAAHPRSPDERHNGVHPARVVVAVQILQNRLSSIRLQVDVSGFGTIGEFGRV